MLHQLNLNNIFTDSDEGELKVENEKVFEATRCLPGIY
jgi:hypothetical protein